MNKDCAIERVTELSTIANLASTKSVQTSEQQFLKRQTIRIDKIDDLATMQPLEPAFYWTLLAFVIGILPLYQATQGTKRPSGNVSRGGLAPYQLKRVTDYIGDRLTEELSLSELADLVGLSAHHFCRVFKESTGLPPHRWQIQKRVEKAKCLMLNSDASLAEISVAVGFSDQSHFTTVFRKATGSTPKAWRRSQRL